MLSSNEEDNIYFSSCSRPAAAVQVHVDVMTTSDACAVKVSGCEKASSALRTSTRTRGAVNNG